jgi:hypothetical protein
LSVAQGFDFVLLREPAPDAISHVGVVISEKNRGG